MIQQERRELGEVAHRLASEQFLRLRHRHNLIVDRRLFVPAMSEMQDVGTLPRVELQRGQLGNRFRNGPDALDPYLDMLCWLLQTRKNGKWWLEPAAPGNTRRPDLVDIDCHEVYEIKPDYAGGQRDGRTAVHQFQNLLSQADAEYLAYRRHSARYKGTLYDALQCQSWHGGLWVPESQSATGPAGSRVWFSFRACPVTPGVLLWSIPDDTLSAGDRQ